MIPIWLLATILGFTPTALAPNASEPVKLPLISSGDMPLYPRFARNGQIEGDVRLRVSTDGAKVIDVIIESGPPLLNRAAQDNVRTWKFETHVPTSFVTVFSYHLRKEFGCDPPRPSNPEVLLKLPTQVDITADTSVRDAYCDATEGLDLSEPLRVFLTACEVDGAPVPCEKMTIRLHSGSLTIVPKRFKESEKKQGFIVPPEFRSLRNYAVSVDTPRGTVFFPNQDIAFLKGNWQVGIDHAPFKESTDVYGKAAELQCIGYIHFRWGEPEVITWGECK